MKPPNTWKAEERKIAFILGGKRIALSGADKSIGWGDVQHDIFLVECKHRTKLPNKTIMGWYREALRDSFGEYEARKYVQYKNLARKIPLLTMHEKGSDSRYCLIEIHDLMKIFKYDYNIYCNGDDK